MALPTEERRRVTESELDRAATDLIAKLNLILFVEDVRDAFRGSHNKRRLNYAVDTLARTYGISKDARKRIFHKLKVEALEEPDDHFFFLLGDK